MSGMPELPVIEDYCCLSDDCYARSGCVCGRDERVLRAYLDEVIVSLMTPQQREWCLSEINCVEGYNRKDYESVTDIELARGVLAAWKTFCEDKGLLCAVRKRRKAGLRQLSSTQL